MPWTAAIHRSDLRRRIQRTTRAQGMRSINCAMRFSRPGCDRLRTRSQSRRGARADLCLVLGVRIEVASCHLFAVSQSQTLIEGCENKLRKSPVDCRHVERTMGDGILSSRPRDLDRSWEFLRHHFRQGRK